MSRINRARKIAGIVALLLPASVATAASKVLPVPMKPQFVNNWCWAASGQMIFDYVGGTTNLQQCDEVNHALGRTDCCGSGACSSDSDCLSPGGQACGGDSDCIPAGAATCKAGSDCKSNEFCFPVSGTNPVVSKCSPSLCRGQCTTQVCGQGCMPAVCNVGGNTEFTPWDFTVQNTACSFLTFSQFKAEIDANRPVEFAWSEGCTDPTEKSCFTMCGNSMQGGHVLVAIGYNDDPKLGQFVYINDPFPVKKGAQYWVSYADWIEQPKGLADAGARVSLGNSSVYFTQSQNYNIKDDAFCHPDVFGMASGDFQHCFDYNNLRGRSPVAISFMTSASGDTVAASFQSVPGRPVRNSLTLDQFDTTSAGLKAQGYRPDSVSVMVKNNVPFVTGIWVPAEATFQSSCRLTSSTLLSNDNTNRSQGYIMTDLFGYTMAPAGASVPTSYFCATWVKKTGSYLAAIDQSSAQYIALFNQKSSTMLPLRLSAYDAATGHLFAALFQSQPQGGWTEFIDMTPTFYQSEYNTLEGGGLHESSITSLDGRYSVLWATPASGR